MIEQQKILRVFKLIKYLSNGNKKTIKEVMNALDTSKATVYRYLELLEDIGYEVIKDNGSYAIETYTDINKFTKEEKKILSTLIHAVDKKNKNHQSILNKIKAFGNEFSPSILSGLKKIKLADDLLFAANHKMAIILYGYKSTDKAAELKERNIIAVDFHEDSLSLLGYDIDSCKFKIYKVSRMNHIAYPETKPTVTLPSKLPELDKFGWSGYDKIKIDILLTTRAAALMIEDFPVTEEYITSTKDKNFPFRYKDYVYGYEGIGRFIMGLCTETKVVSNQGLKDYIRGKLANSTIFDDK